MDDRLNTRLWKIGMYNASYIVEGGRHGYEIWVLGRDSLERYWSGNVTGYGNYWKRMPMDREEMLSALEKGALERGLYDEVEKTSKPNSCGPYLNISGGIK